jgi:hypothetical protein
MKTKMSGSALFMYIVILLCILLAAAGLCLYYTGVWAHASVLWTGITTFTILYRFGGRILLGKLTLHMPLDHKHFWFREKCFERKLYKLLCVRKWKEKVLTYDPAAFSVQNHTLEEIATTMTKSETDHWINQLISLSTLLFAIPWGVFWIFFTTAILSMLFDAQFIIVQRYNRPIVLRLMERGIQRV